ncbi:NAD(P)H-hydrate dehydratase [Aquabacterium sp.]|uniref:NAD(P)H-hydrate dehydratase n=1 Tax=Aquabacterium sp. TaxID=1872578 RepID=UPI0035B20C2C
MKLLDDCPEPAIQRILPASRASAAHPLHDVEASRLIEQAATAALPPHALMRRAGRAVARLALAVAPHAQRIWVVAGPGNNGGDGLDAAIHLHQAGKTVHVSLLADSARLPADAADALQRARNAGVPISTPLSDGAEDWLPWPDSLGAHDLVIDALLGLGSRRAPAGMLGEAVNRINHCSAIVLAVDLPTGLDADAGWLDIPDTASRCVRADHTLSLLTLKPGLFTANGRDVAGTIWLCDLGLTPLALDIAARHAPIELIGAPPATARQHAQHKGSFGSVVVVGGAHGMTGAALLAARTALRVGAGRVYVQWLDAVAPLAVDPLAPDLMLHHTIDWHAPSAADYTVVAGCGGGLAIREVLPLLLSRARRLVLDADALNAVASDSILQALLTQRRNRGWQTVLTPHPLEAARLLSISAADVQTDRLSHARSLAQRTGSIVVLKGSGTVVQEPDGPVHINPTGNASLGTAGTGDVLAGWIGGLWAQAGNAAAAACQAVYLHGLRADEWQAERAGRLTATALAASI